MKFLLFFVSLIFSYIFYIFYNLTKWKNYLWNIIQNPVNLSSFSWNILIESFIFLLIWIIFLYFFSDFKVWWKEKTWVYKNEVIYFIFYTLFIFYMYFLNKWFDSFIIIIIIIFVLSDVLFNHLSNISRLNSYKIKFRYIWLLLSYLSAVLSFYYILKNWISVILLFILFFSFYFNLVVHKKYTNYISLIVSTSIIFFLFYCLYFFVIKLYI